MNFCSYATSRIVALPAPPDTRTLFWSTRQIMDVSDGEEMEYVLTAFREARDYNLLNTFFGFVSLRN
jgi:hypothetical protein